MVWRHSREWFFASLLIVVSLAVSLFLLEWGSRLLYEADEVTKFPRRPQPNVMQPNAVDGTHHLIENLNFSGPEPWEPSSKRLPSDHFEIRSNRFGFFTDYPIDEFPSKEPGEYRIILTGGSGAQGHGASKNENMFYKRLEVELSERLKHVSPRVRVINLAQAGGYAFTNAKVLNAFGHRLGADLILLYIGPNDLAIPYEMSFISSCSDYAEWLIQSSFDYPNLIRPLVELFPRLFNVHGAGPWVKRIFFSQYYEAKGKEVCLRQFRALDNKGGRLTGMAFYDKVAHPYLVHGLKSIKRDFCGLPIAVVRQAIHYGENRFYESWYGPGIYDRWWKDAQADVARYVNDEWYFYDFHWEAHARDNSDIAGFVPESLAIHLDDPGHVLAALLLSNFLEPIVRQQISMQRDRQCNDG